MSNKENFLKLVSNKKTDTLERSKARIKRREMLRESQQIALKVLNRLDELDWTQKKLAKEMGVSPQQINKIVKGKENLTLETQIELQTILDIPILASFYDNKKREAKLETKKSFLISIKRSHQSFKQSGLERNKIVYAFRILFFLSTLIISHSFLVIKENCVNFSVLR